MARAKQIARNSTGGKDPLKRAPATDGVKKTHRYRLGKAALLEIGHYQKSSELLYEKLYFKHMVREIVHDLKTYSCFYTPELRAVQEAKVAYLEGVIQKFLSRTVHKKRVYILIKDIQLARRIRGVRA